MTRFKQAPLWLIPMLLASTSALARDDNDVATAVEAVARRREADRA